MVSLRSKRWHNVTKPANIYVNVKWSRCFSLISATSEVRFSSEKWRNNPNRSSAVCVDYSTVFSFVFCHVKLSSWREVRVYCLAGGSHLAWVAMGTQMLFRHCLRTKVPFVARIDDLNVYFRYQWSTIGRMGEIACPFTVLSQQKPKFYYTTVT